MSVQPKGLMISASWVGSGVLWAGEWNAMAEGTWEKVQVHKRGKLGREGGLP